MPSQPHTVLPPARLPWVVRRARLPLLSLRCVDCRSESATAGEGRFRINANGKLLDVWLLVRCVSCDRTSKLTVHERAPARSFDPAQIHRYRVNDPELAEGLGLRRKEVPGRVKCDISLRRPASAGFTFTVPAGD